MAKVNGLNVRLYVEGYDLSGDANALSGLGYTSELLDVTTLDVSARKRIVGIVDSEISIDAWFDNAASRQHAVWTSNSGKQPTADQDILVPMGSAVGDPCVGLVSKQGTMTTTRAPGSAIAANATFSANGSGAEFGEMLTAHDDTHSSAGSANSSIARRLWTVYGLTPLLMTIYTVLHAGTVPSARFSVTVHVSAPAVSLVRL